MFYRQSVELNLLQDFNLNKLVSDIVVKSIEARSMDKVKRSSNPRRKYYWLFVILVLVLLLILLPKGIVEQIELPTPEPIPTHLYEYAMTFPNFLLCSEANRNSVGTNWEGIIIGRSKIADVFEVAEQWSNDDYYSIRADRLGSDVGYTILLSGVDHSGTRQAANTIRFCVIDDTIFALVVSYPVGSNLYIDDFVAQYSIPQAISYDVGSPASRIVFWFDEGVAAKVSVLDEEGSFGRINTVIYFAPPNDPTQSWPYNHSVSGQTNDISQSEFEDWYGEENPFDFETMLATINSQPARIATPAFTPLPSMSTATP